MSSEGFKLFWTFKSTSEEFRGLHRLKVEFREGLRFPGVLGAL